MMPTAGAGPTSPDHGLRLIALVCSAGGLDALSTVLSQLPAGFPAAIIVLQHLAPDRPSRLPEILGRRTAIPVVDAEDGAVLRAGQVVVVPPAMHLLVTADNRLVLVASDGPPPYRPSADLLLSSLAVAAAPRTIAVILSGLGSDGAVGAAAVHALGGVVLATDPASTAFPSMPEAAISRPDIVDHIAPVTEIAALLTRLVKGADVTVPVAD